MQTQIKMTYKLKNRMVNSKNGALQLKMQRSNSKELKMADNSLHYNHLLSASISDIKTYTGKDPLLPWIRGIKTMRETLPSLLLKEKLPRFLQRCTQTFKANTRYKNDLRYLRVWLRLMDYVDDPRALLIDMEANCIGVKRSSFYQAYALYYEKSKKFEEADKIYHLGVNNLAEPVNELQKSYENFLQRMERRKRKMLLCQKSNSLADKRIPLPCSRKDSSNDNSSITEDKPKKKTENFEKVKPGKKSKYVGSNNFCENAKGSDSDTVKQQSTSERGSNNARMFSGEDTVAVKRFVEVAIVGKSEAEDACHHGLVDPTINMKEAMNAINSMFSKPLDTGAVKRRSHRPQHKEDHSLSNGFNIFIDEDMENGIEPSRHETRLPLGHQDIAQTHKPSQDILNIFIDDEEDGEIGVSNDEKDDLELCGDLTPPKLSSIVFPSPSNLLPESSDEQQARSTRASKLGEDTVVCRFVGCTISEDPKVENVCHHGLVEPTINLKEAMEDINHMFGKPIDFVRAKRPKKQLVSSIKKEDPGCFLILPDDNLEQETQPKSPSKAIESDLHEPTLFTKEAMDEIK